MFKGFSENLKKILEEYNQNSECFIFNVSDLEYSSDRNQGEHKFDIYSKELRQKLGNIIVANGGTISNPTSIKFVNLEKKDENGNYLFELPPRFKSNGTRNYNS